MKWMWSGAIVIAAVSSALGAQSGGEMAKDAMTGATKTTYTGCLIASNHGGTFLLTNVGDDHMGRMDDQVGTMKDDMTPGSLFLTGSSELKKHVHQKVSVTGSLAPAKMDAMGHDTSTLNVTSLKVVAKSCS